MKLLHKLIVAALLGLTAVGSWAAPAHVQSIGNLATTATNHTRVLPSVSAGSLLTVAIKTASTGYTVSDNVNSGSWTQLCTQTNGTGTRLFIFYRVNSAAASPSLTVTITNGVSTTIRAVASEYTGVATSSPVDASVCENSPAGTTHTTSNITTTVTGTLLYSTLALDTSSTIAPALGETERLEVSSPPLLQVQDRISGAAGTFAASWTLSSSEVGARGLVAFKPAAAVAPSFSSGPSAVATTGGYTISATPNTSSTLDCVATVKGSANPTATQVKAGQNGAGAAALAAAEKAITGADTLSLTGLTFPTHDVHCVLSNGAGDSAVSRLTNRFKLPPAGKQYSTFASVAAGTVYAAIASPAVAVGDTREIDLVVSPSANAVTALTDGNDSFDSDGSRQYYDTQVYDDSAGGWMSVTGGGTSSRVWFNDQPPVADGISFDVPLEDDAAMETINLCDRFTDEEGDSLTGSNSTTGVGSGVNKRPTGTTITGCEWTGTPTTEESGSFTFTAKDTAEAAGTITVNYTVIDTITVPPCANVSASQYEATLDTLFVPWVVSGATFSETVAPGNIISCSPAAGGEVDPFASEVSLLVSFGMVSSTAQTGGFNLQLTSAENATLYAVVLRRGATAPIASQIETGDDASGANALASGSVVATAGNAIALNLTGLPLPRYDLYVVGKRVDGTYTQVTALLNRRKSPATGRQYIDVDVP
jgi:hypothetical protein